MTIGFMDLFDHRFRLTDLSHSEEIGEEQPCFHLTEGASDFHAEQIAAEGKKSPIQRVLHFLKHFTRMFWGYFTLPTIYEECSPILLEAKIEVKTTRYRELSMVFCPSSYAPDLHDYTAPRLEGGKDFTVTPIGYRVNEQAIGRRRRETLAERLGLSLFLLVIPVLLMIASAVIKVPTLGMIAIFAAVALYTLIPILFYRWHKMYKNLAQKAKQKADELNHALGVRDY